MEEIKVELRQDNIGVKANAVAKLTYVSSQVYSVLAIWYLYTNYYISIIFKQKKKKNASPTDQYLKFQSFRH